MRKFLEPNGVFELKIPITWEYSLKNDKVHTFQDCEIWKSDTFQLSLIRLETPEQETNVSSLLMASTKINDKDIIYHVLPETHRNDFSTKKWIRKFERTIVFFTLTYTTESNPELESLTIQERVEIVKAVIQSFKLIEDKKRESHIKSFRFESFLQGVATTMYILNNSIENKAFIETICILANQIDALLRTGIILKSQLINRNNEIDTEWIYQGPDDRKKSEKDIYKKANELGIINTSELTQLYNLFEHRNRVIHRFIISEITYAEVEDIAYSYYQLQESIYKTIYDLESEQIKLGIGMTIQGTDEKNIPATEIIKGKLGNLKYFEKLTNN